ncbi:MAG TPA: tetratricopeptide repeat protein [Longimicrobiales bacterium]|nr:tetratricopeptide repeat protein [Longimicrobiales bacterium]
MRVNWRDLVQDRGAMVALLLATACAVYLNTLVNGFALDDVPIILDNPRVRDLGDLRRIWLTPYWPYFGVELGLWRPLAIFGYALQWAAGGGSAGVFHAVSIALHAGVTLLTFLLLERLFTRGAAFAGAFVFAVHPVHTEAVANVVGQAELITAAALIGACVIHAARPPGMEVSWPRRFALMLCFAAGMLAKENAVVLPGLLLAVDFAQRRVPLTLRGAARYADALLMPMLLLATVLAAYLIVRFGVLEGALLGVEAGPQYHYLRGEYRVLNALRAMPEFLRLLVFPQSLAADYSPALVLPVESVNSMVVVGAVLLTGVVLLSAAMPWFPAAGFPAAWFLVSIITVSNLFFPIGVLIAERTLYLPSVAASVVVALAWTAARASAVPRTRALAPLLLAIVLVAGAARTWVRNPDWKTTRSVLYSLLRDHPESYKAQWTHAGWQWQLGNLDVARVHFEYAIMIYPRDSQLLTEYGNFLMSYDDLDQAITHFETAYEIHPYVPRTLLLLGTAYVAAGRYDDALRIAQAADDHTRNFSVSMPIRAAAWDGLGRDDRAHATWRFVIRFAALHPPLHWGYLARTLARRGHLDEAGVALDRGIGAAAQDTAVTRVLTETRAALEAGCYAAVTAPAPGDTVHHAAGVPGPLGCDPIDRYIASLAGGQNATALHYATNRPWLFDRP